MSALPQIATAKADSR